MRATFTQKPDVSVATVPMTVGLADINGDGKVDLLTPRYIQDTVTIWRNDGAGTFPNAPLVSTGSYSVSIAVADVNRDGLLDLLVANVRDGTVSVCRGDGLGGFSGGKELAAGWSASFVTAKDINGDGYLDIVVSNGNDGPVSVFLAGEAIIATASTDRTGTLKIGDTITFTLSTDIPVTVRSVPELVLSNGGCGLTC